MQNLERDRCAWLAEISANVVEVFAARKLMGFHEVKTCAALRKKRGEAEGRDVAE
jgi:hypothetical protein